MRVVTPIPDPDLTGTTDRTGAMSDRTVAELYGPGAFVWSASLPAGTPAPMTDAARELLASLPDAEMKIVELPGRFEDDQRTFRMTWREFVRDVVVLDPDAFRRERVGTWPDPEPPAVAWSNTADAWVPIRPGDREWTPVPVPPDPGADPEDGRCLLGCGHDDDDPRCTGTWRMSDFGEAPF